MQSAFVALGGNLGDAKKVLQEAALLLVRNPKVRSWKMSSLMRTSPVSPVPQPDYWNAVLFLRTRENPWNLFTRMRKVETHFGKVPKRKETPRPLDLDLLFSSVLTCHSSYLELPHPRMWQRRFVLAPLAELVPALPGSAPLGELLEKCPADQEIFEVCPAEILLKAQRKYARPIL